MKERAIPGRGLAIAALVALAYNTTVWASPYGLIAFLSVTYIYTYIQTYNFDTVLRDYMPRAKALGNYSDCAIRT